MLKTWPFHARTAPLVRSQTSRRWAGYQVASADAVVRKLPFFDPERKRA